MLFIKRRNSANFSNKDSQYEKEIQESLDESKYFQKMADDAVNKVQEEKEMLPNYEKEASKYMTPKEIEEEKARFNNALSQMESDARAYMSSKAQQDAIIANGEVPLTLRGSFWPEFRENVGTRQIPNIPEPKWTSGQVPQAHQLPEEYQPRKKVYNTAETLKRLLKGNIAPSKNDSLADRYRYLIRNTAPKQ